MKVACDPPPSRVYFLTIFPAPAIAAAAPPPSLSVRHVLKVHIVEERKLFWLTESKKLKHPIGIPGDSRVNPRGLTGVYGRSRLYVVNVHVLPCVFYAAVSYLVIKKDTMPVEL